MRNVIPISRLVFEGIIPPGKVDPIDPEDLLSMEDVIKDFVDDEGEGVYVKDALDPGRVFRVTMEGGIISISDHSFSYDVESFLASRLGRYQVIDQPRTRWY